MAIGFLLLFHFASIFSMATAHHAVGVGWTYLNFQIATVMYALLIDRHQSTLYSLAAVLLIWYWWLPRTAQWPVYYGLTLLLMFLTQRYRNWITGKMWRYFPLALAFAVPFVVMNYVSVQGIDVGWPWEIASCVLIAWLLWLVHHRFLQNRAKTALLQAEARLDELTQLHNFRVFNEDLLLNYHQSQISHKPFALFTFDIDHFKAINDRYGHLMGNQVLEAVAAQLKILGKELPYPDVHCYRTGGEEFSVIIPKIVPSMTLAQTIAWQIHDELGKLQFTSDAGQQFQITVSLGEDRSHSEDQNYLDVYNRADQYLYNSKRSGRNTITINGQTLPQR